jgi:hypothetical protein
VNVFPAASTVQGEPSESRLFQLALSLARVNIPAVQFVNGFGEEVFVTLSVPLGQVPEFKHELYRCVQVAGAAVVNAGASDSYQMLFSTV